MACRAGAYQKISFVAPETSQSLVAHLIFDDDWVIHFGFDLVQWLVFSMTRVSKVPAATVIFATPATTE